MEYEYDIAISYESKQKNTAKEVANYLIYDGWKVFWAPYEQEQLMSEELKAKLYRIFRRESCIKVLFVTKEYLQSEWTQMEARCALESTKKNLRRLILINYMGSEMPEAYRSKFYLEGSLHEDEIAAFISNRAEELLRQGKIDKKSKENYVKKNYGIVSGNDLKIKKFIIRIEK